MKNKQSIINQIHETSNISKKVIENVVNSFLDNVCNELIAGNEVKIYGFGVFKISTRLAHTGYNPIAGTEIDVPERKVVKLKLSKRINKLLNSESKN